MVLSKHARMRMQQRGIQEPVVEWLLAYGQIDHQRGSELYYFNRRSRQALERDIGPRAVQQYAKALNTYAVCVEGMVATVGHRYQRVVRH